MRGIYYMRIGWLFRVSIFGLGYYSSTMDFCYSRCMFTDIDLIWIKRLPVLWNLHFRSLSSIQLLDSNSNNAWNFLFDMIPMLKRLFIKLPIKLIFNVWAHILLCFTQLRTERRATQRAERRATAPNLALPKDASSHTGLSRFIFKCSFKSVVTLPLQKLSISLELERFSIDTHYLLLFLS